MVAIAQRVEVEAVVSTQAEVGEFQRMGAAVQDFQNQLDDLNRTRVDIPVDFDFDKAEREYQAWARRERQLMAELVLDTEKATMRLDGWKASTTKVKAELELDLSAATSRLREFGGQGVKIKATVELDLQAARARLEAFGSSGGVTVRVVVDLSNAILRMEAFLSHYNGQTIRIDVDLRTAGAQASLAALIASLLALRGAAGGVGGATSSAGAGLLAMSAAAVALVAGVGLLVAALGPLVAILAIAAAGLAALVAVVALVAAPFALMAANTKEANDRLKENEQQQKAVATASEQLKAQQEGLADAVRAEGEARRQAGEQNAAAMKSYRDSLDGVATERKRLNELEAAVGDAAKTRQEGINAAVRAYKDQLNTVAESRQRLNELEAAVGDAVKSRQEGITKAVEGYNAELGNTEDRERDVKTAREQLRSATRAQESAQTGLVRALQDEQYLLQRMNLDVAGIRLSLEEGTLREAEAQERLNEALRSGDPREVQRARLELRRIDLDQQKLNLDLRDSLKARNEAEKNGTENLKNARSQVEQTGKARKDAEQGVTMALRALGDQAKRTDAARAGIEKARLEGDKRVAASLKAVSDQQRNLSGELRKANQLEKGISKAREEGNKSVAKAVSAVADQQDAVRKAVENSETQWKNVRQTQLSGQRQIADATRNVKRQQDAVAKAAQALREATKGGADDAGLLERAWRKVKGPVNAVFGPAIREAQELSKSLKEQGMEILPSLGRASERATRGIRLGFESALKTISPQERASFGAALKLLGPMAFDLSRAAVDVGISFGNFVGQNAPRLRNISKSVRDVARDMREWLKDPQNREKLNQFLKSGESLFRAVWKAVKDLTPIIVDLGIKHAPTLAKAIHEASRFLRLLLDALDGVLKVAKPVLSFFGDLATAINDTSIKSGKTTEEVRGSWAKLGKYFEWAGPGLQNAMVTPFANANKRIVANSIVPDMVRDIEGWWKGLPGKIGSALKDLPEKGSKQFEKLWDKLTRNSVVPDMLNDVEGRFRALPRRTEDALKDLPNSMSKPFADGAAAVDRHASNMEAKMRSFKSATQNELKDGIVSLGEVGQSEWDRLLKAGWKGRPGDSAERLYAPTRQKMPPVDSVQWNSMHDPNRGQPGYAQAEDGSWVKQDFYGGKAPRVEAMRAEMLREQAEHKRRLDVMRRDARAARQEGMLRAEDGSVVPPGFYGGASGSSARTGKVRAEDGSYVPRDFYGNRTAPATPRPSGGSGSGSGGITKEEMRQVLREAHREGAQETARLIRAGVAAGIGSSEIQGLLDKLMSGDFDHRTGAGSDPV